MFFPSSDYEEDFEADDEGPVEEATVEEEKSPSPVRGTEILVQEENISETDDDGNDGGSVSQLVCSFLKKIKNQDVRKYLMSFGILMIGDQKLKTLNSFAQKTSCLVQAPVSQAAISKKATRKP